MSRLCGNTKEPQEDIIDSEKSSLFFLTSKEKPGMDLIRDRL